MSGNGTGVLGGDNHRLVDTHTKSVHKLVSGAKHVIGKRSVASCVAVRSVMYTDHGERWGLPRAGNHALVHCTNNASRTCVVGMS